MVTQTAEATIGEVEVGERRAGLIDRAIDAFEHLPGPTLVWILGFFVLWELLLNGALWLSGQLTPGSFDTSVSLAPGLGSYALALLIVLDRVAAGALADFRPALGDHPDADRLATELRRTPDGQALVVVAVLVVVVTAGYLLDPSGAANLLTRPLAGIAISVVGYWLAIALLGVLVLRTLRQLRLVGKLHQAAQNIDLFNPSAINALSRLTGATAIGFLFFTVPYVLLAPLETTQGGFYGPVQIVAFALLGIASFALPLRGMHNRMVGEKRRLLGTVNRRLKTTVERVHATVDSDDMTRADGLQKTMTSLLAERDVIARLSTWPWSPDTFRGFATALVLPVVIWLVLRLLERIV